MKRLGALAFAFASGCYQIAAAARLAEDPSVTARVLVAVQFVILIVQAFYMAMVATEGESQRADYSGTYPPTHPNCRCSIAPLRDGNP